ncbi:uncharacterized protein A1O9_11212 [Exophiala aquamarina CBS 119918]|uniref:FAD-binding domain-containing protein n=1 Tax=Exophiala aquamarina CBS 119918 TaxID=1182545 RepID=A0A072PB81_9EURO|nr:uncharacterized protein A1O9_11212 [Exophiala aquamarina CBS 119918]KEF52795.1 hypothetical protein A1O9_11212 [Exophiala aquamarina CBS 119918]
MKVIIIGSGLAGPALALALKQRNISCKIFELRDKAAFEGGFVALAPNALRVLDRIGMYDRLSSQGYNYEQFQFVSSRNLSPIGTVLNGSQNNYGYKALRIARGTVRQTLLDALNEQKIEIQYDSKCVKIEETDHDTVIATFADGHTEEADILIGTDGIHSRVRNYIDASVIPTFSGQMGVGGSLPKTKLGPQAKDMHMPCMVMGKLNSFAFMPCDYSGSRVGCFATIESKDRSREEWNRLQADKDTLHDYLRSHHEHEQWPEIVHLASEHVDKETLSLWPYYRVPKLKSWTSSSGRVVVIGDAAHAMPPTGGQGAAMAFEDGITLADTLTRVNGKDSDLQRLLKSWQTVRQKRIGQILAFTSRSGDSRKASSSTLQQIFKEWAMWAYFLWKGEDAGLSWVYKYDSKTFAHD